MIDEDLVTQATYTNLADFCCKLGFTVVLQGNQYYLKEHDSLYISVREPWKWYRFSTGEGGKAIDFCMKVLQMSFSEAVQALTGSVPAPASGSAPVPDARRVIAYLCQKRCISYDVVKHLLEMHKLLQDERGNCAFLVQDFDGSQIGAEIHGTGDKRYKALSFAGRFEGYGFTLRTQHINTVCYFESAVDLISFCEIFYQKITNYLLVSMGGLRSQTVQKYQERYPDARHLLFVDHDIAGKEFSCRVGLSVKYPEYGKDWNEYLQYLRGKNDVD